MSATWPAPITAITLLVDDLDEARTFDARVVDLSTVFEDDNLAVFRIGDVLVNLLRSTEAGVLIEPARVASAGSGARFQLKIDVDDVDAVCERLRERGVTLLNGPADRSWGLRTAAFADAAGHVWEIAH